MSRAGAGNARSERTSRPRPSRASGGNNAEMRRKVLSNAGRRQPQMLTDCRDRFSRLLARAVVQIASGDRDEVNKPPPRYPVTSGSALVGVWSEARHGCVIVGQAIIREAASKMELEANVRRTTAQRTAQSNRPSADR